MNFALFALRYLFLFLFLVTLGALSLAGLNALLKPRWLGALSPRLKILSLSVLPLTGVFILVLLFRAWVFPWVIHPPRPGSFQHFYYGEVFFAFRGFFYLTFAGTMVWCLQSSKKILGALSLVLILFLGSFASYDWVMSQSPGFHSTIFGLFMIINACLITHALCLSCIDTQDEGLLLDLNQIHLALVSLWSYLALMQFLIVWSGNLPEEVVYFKDRFQGLGGTLAVICLAGQTLIPIPLLLFRKLKKSRPFTKKLGIYTLVLQALHLGWLIGYGS